MRHLKSREIPCSKLGDLPSQGTFFACGTSSSLAEPPRALRELLEPCGTSSCFAGPLPCLRYLHPCGTSSILAGLVRSLRDLLDPCGTSSILAGPPPCLRDLLHPLGGPASILAGPPRSLRDLLDPCGISSIHTGPPRSLRDLLDLCGTSPACGTSLYISRHLPIACETSSRPAGHAIPDILLRVRGSPASGTFGIDIDIQCKQTFNNCFRTQRRDIYID